MKHIFDAAGSLAAGIRESAAHAEYLTARARLEQRPELLPLLSDYRRRNRELADAEDAGENDLLPYRQRVSEAYYAAACHGELLRFLEAERDVVAMVCEVLDIVSGGCEVELGGEARL
jgi:cell fate (sporulation/competence/biofilm development) regulator YlbF (YheA/YmcA/DUF963 family)